jgi:L-alanine-DL-glutamate epimerase-like enolase superfamily enzyme
MRITAMRTARVVLPIEPPLSTAIHKIDSVGCVLVSLETDAGLTGEGYVFSLSALRLDVMEAMIQSLEHHVIGQDPHDVERLWEAMWRDINFFGHKGITIIGISAFDTACWDLIGKAADQPLHRLFGACRERVKAYASGGLWLSLSIDELVAEARSFLDQGFRAMKLRVGNPRPDEDAERVAAVRETIGPDIDLMVDANQGLTVDHAIRLGRKLEALDLVWFEEPVAYYDLAGHAAIAAALDTPIASGETEYTRHGMRAMIEARAADILMPDLQRMGGLSEFRKASHLAAAHEIPVSPHIFTEQSLCLAGSLANITLVEHMPWFGALYRENMELVDGEIPIPDRPGVGFTFDWDALEGFRQS